MGGQVEDQGPTLQLHQAHPDEEPEHPAQGGSLGRPALPVRQAGPRLGQPPPQRPLPQDVQDGSLEGHPGGDLFPGSGAYQAIHGLYQPDSVQHAGRQAQVVDL
jgi:hypothetical protein